ncbi:MAG: Holliday junction DNA helicase RuvA [Gammaproteobacteria bacterium RBG_16_57_12]|nr:MAG: Holliday junction DNA helicase RuvA [Gammaproteobacteria bacterium RBG_16_57_12]
MSHGHRSLLAFDFGKRRIGVAVGQEITRTAMALTTLAAREGQPDWEAVTRLIEEWRPNALVVGMPYALDGTENEMTLAVKRFGNRLQGRYNLPVHYVDERLSSLEAERLLKEGAGKKFKEKGLIDRLAAQLILQTWFDQQTRGTA